MRTAQRPPENSTGIADTSFIPSSGIDLIQIKSSRKEEEQLPRQYIN